MKPRQQDKEIAAAVFKPRHVKQYLRSNKSRDPGKWGGLFSPHGPARIGGVKTVQNELDPVEMVADRFNIAADRREDFRNALEGLAESFAASARPALPDAPAREYRPRESIIDYLRSPEGFGPWVDAGALTRPLLREKAPRAYTALANWLRNNELPADLPVPTKSATVTARLEAISGQPIPPEKRALAASLERGLRHALRQP